MAEFNFFACGFAFIRWDWTNHSIGGTHSRGTGRAPSRWPGERVA